jgi:hypothetical protein
MGFMARADSWAWHEMQRWSMARHHSATGRLVAGHVRHNRVNPVVAWSLSRVTDVGSDRNEGVVLGSGV